MSHSKNHFRKLGMGARLALGAEARAHKSRVITGLLRDWEPYRQAHAICLYASFGSEVQTELLLQEAYAAASPPASERFFCLPRVEGSELVLHQLEAPAMGESSAATTAPGSAAAAWAGFAHSPMGMPEPPVTLPVVLPQVLDIVLVPGSAFSLTSGHRLGYGKGFYDRLLARAPQALKVGLCFDVQIFDTDAFPADPHDIALDALVSESGIRDLRL